MDPESEPLSNPPPAYSEQEFDQKVSLATELSVFDDDGWQQYDPYAFEDDCAPNLTSKCTGRLGLQGPPFPTAPLRFEKNQQSNGLEAHSVNNQNASTSYSSWPEAGPLPSKSILPHPEDLYTSKHIHVPYSSSARTVPQQGGQVENQPMPLSYHSKTQSTVTLPLPQPVIPQNHPTPNVSKSNYHDSPTSRRLRSLPATPAPKHAFKVEERPISTYHPIQAPLVHFDASMAYGNATPPSSLIEQPIASKSNIQSDSYLFYKSVLFSNLVE